MSSAAEGPTTRGRRLTPPQAAWIPSITFRTEKHVLGGQLIENAVELGHQVGGQDVRAGALFVERQRGDVVAVVFELPLTVIACQDDYSVSPSTAPRSPPPMQMEAMPRLPFRRLSTC